MKIKLNLIPDEKKDEIKSKIRLKNSLVWEAKFLGIFLVFFLILISINYILKINLTAVSAGENLGVSQEKIEEIARYESDVKKTNSELANIDKIQKKQFYWSKFFLKLDQVFDSSITLSSIVTHDYRVVLSGQAAERDKLIEFKEKLVQEECFQKVDLPLSNLTLKQDVDFTIELEISEECLNKTND
ncbi:MAG: hypothetical protein COU40_00120 [Candidatus Moranbacteria bacterium CG10_big_fil_rev_8_21_14_0_10_35_21]|nr:MAG: hypothetical protein COU40_00120 [Candidatus Moranbacteria bacterium CG10_big_fil_rev_8_21_14_0_10_35_21]PJA88462.1 MAG: hypothetical protein CO139_03085 [Candidatus Moranbacteria bacterium CG_4_9_14_3_um_filter_36_9]